MFSEIQSKENLIGQIAWFFNKEITRKSTGRELYRLEEIQLSVESYGLYLNPDKTTNWKKKRHSEKFEHELVFDKVKELLILF